MKTTYQDLWDTPKAILRKLQVQMPMLLKRPHIGDLTLYLKILEKGQTKPRTHRRKMKNQ